MFNLLIQHYEEMNLTLWHMHNMNSEHAFQIFGQDVANRIKFDFHLQSWKQEFKSINLDDIPMIVLDKTITDTPRSSREAKVYFMRFKKYNLICLCFVFSP